MDDRNEYNERIYSPEPIYPEPIDLRPFHRRLYIVDGGRRREACMDT